MKLTTRNGTILSCGCEPPADPKAAGLIARDGAVLSYMVVGAVEAHTPPAGEDELPGLEKHCGTWLCAGIWLVVRVTVSAPQLCASANPGPTCTGTLL